MANIPFLLSVLPLCFLLQLVLSIDPPTLTGAFDDPYILCSGDRAGPPPTFGSWPLSYSADQYRDNIDLCSAAFGKRVVNADGSFGDSLNLGCQCATANSRPVCHEALADPILWNYQGFNDDPLSGLISNGQPMPLTFQNYCANFACICTTAAIALTYFPTGAIGHATFTYSIYGNTVGMLVPLDALPYSDPSIDGTMLQQQCSGDTSGSCSSISDCNVHTNFSAIGPPNSLSEHAPPDVGDSDTDPPCLCQSVNQTVSGSLANVFHFTECYSLLGRKDKRDDEQRPCPCNATYVSHKCCTSWDGLVWEDPEMYLGQVMLDEEL